MRLRLGGRIIRAECRPGAWHSFIAENLGDTFPLTGRSFWFREVRYDADEVEFEAQLSGSVRVRLTALVWPLPRSLVRLGRHSLRACALALRPTAQAVDLVRQPPIQFGRVVVPFRRHREVQFGQGDVDAP